MRTAGFRDEAVRRIQDKQAVVGIIGLGYVGLPLVLAFGRQGFPLIGFDIDPEKIEQLASGGSYIRHIPSEEIASLNATGLFQGTTDFSRAGECDALILCVPTPLTAQREPDMKYVERTCESIAPHLRKGQLVSLESTTYPGTTTEVMVPLLESGSGMKADRHFFVAYSPEREDPNNRQFTTATIPKIVGADSPEALDVAVAFYSAVVQSVVPVSSCAAAEAAKLVENIFRCVNIAMVNELKIVFHRMGIDIWEVVNAAKTKPFGFMPFYPGPGLGGHCIPIDPFYLTWKAREFDMPTKFIELAGEINSQMPFYVVSRAMEALNSVGRALKGSRVLLVGMAYKADVDDTRESPALKLLDIMSGMGAEVDYHDPYIPQLKPTRKYPEFAGRQSVSLDHVGEYDLVVITTAHSIIDYEALARQARLVVDTRNALANVESGTTPVFKA